MVAQSAEELEGLAELKRRGDRNGVRLEEVTEEEAREIDPAAKTHNKVQKAAMQHGLMVYGMGGTIDGRYGDHVLLAPPYTINEEHESELVEKLTAAINAI